MASSRSAAKMPHAQDAGHAEETQRGSEQIAEHPEASRPLSLPA